MKALVLISGGLDSILAAKVLQEQGIEIVPLNFKIPFCHRAKANESANKLSVMVRANLGQDLQTVSLDEEFLKLLIEPEYGFGSNFNPCIDCKILMLSKARELMQGLGAAFVATGEVLGQRPMSQHRMALQIIEKKSGLNGLLLRPLSAVLLEETIPEAKGWVDRFKLLNVSGRSRKQQFELASKFFLKDYSNPAGGCLLTDPVFSKRLKELINHRELSVDNIELLKIGRHFRLAQDVKLAVGRNELENGQLVSLAKEGDHLFYPTEKMAGPVSLGRGEFNESLLRLSCSITSRYCDLNGASVADIIFKKLPAGEEMILKALPLDEKRLNPLRI